MIRPEERPLFLQRKKSAEIRNFNISQVGSYEDDKALLRDLKNILTSIHKSDFFANIRIDCYLNVDPERSHRTMNLIAYL